MKALYCPSGRKPQRPAQPGLAHHRHPTLIGSSGDPSPRLGPLQDSTVQAEVRVGGRVE
jgi:hypothetical protein